MLLRQAHEDLLIPQERAVYVAPRAMHAAEVDSKNLLVCGIAVELLPPLCILCDGSKCVAHVPARGFLATPGDSAIDFDRSGIMPGEQALPPSSLINSNRAF